MLTVALTNVTETVRIQVIQTQFRDSIIFMAMIWVDENLLIDFLVLEATLVLNRQFTIFFVTATLKKKSLVEKCDVGLEISVKGG